MKKTDFNRGWFCNGKAVTLPHDAMLHTERRADAGSGSSGAYFSGGRYTYEKTFEKPGEEHVILEFEGVYKNARVLINGVEAGGALYGYLPFFISLDGLLKDGENTITVTCDNADTPDSRWYSGAGIYRPVWLHTGNGDVIMPESVQIRTLSVEPPAVEISAPFSVRTEILDGDKILASEEGEKTVFELKGARLWSDNDPKLYTCRVSSETDSVCIPFGIRKISWSNKGLFVNGAETLLRGGCLHHDSGILGTATFDESEFRRIRILKEAGFNAIRSAHNPCSRALLDACDKLGVYVMDEAWDIWFHHKSKYDYASFWSDHFKEDLSAIVKRDFNHPSVLMYSIGNEVSEPAKPEGIRLAKEMTELLHKLDPGRAVTAGINLTILNQSANGKYTWDPEKGGKSNNDTEQAATGMSSTFFNLATSFVGTGMNKAANGKKADRVTSPILDTLDIAGYNYASGRYPLEGKAHPDRIVVGSETFPQDIAKNWAMVRKYPYLIGDYMWTAWDYIGEVGIGAWAYTADGRGFDKPYPWLLADTGAYDILGNPTGEAFWASAVWGKGTRVAVQPINHDRKPAKAVWRGTNAIPSWSWKGCEGKKATVEVYTDAVWVELLLNGSVAAKGKVRNCRAILKVKYQPGTLTAVAYDAGGREIGRDTLQTAKDANLIIKAEEASARPGGMVFFRVLVADENGIVESNDDRKVTVTVENGELLGFGSANPRTEERFTDGNYTTYYGHSLVAVRAGESGSVRITADDGKKQAVLELSILPSEKENET
ncbi:MAG: DUF4982 domain-containing protein [Clostridia bacterium]|nr:DUF4982 domain-containing protein [Clostridia bacterium]